MTRPEVLNKLISCLIDTLTQGDLVDMATEHLERHYEDWSVEELTQLFEETFADYMDKSEGGK